MPKLRITKESVERVESPATGQALYYDDKTIGFGLRVTPGSKTFIVETRIKGKVRRLSLGRFGKITADQARDLAKSKLGEIAFGGDPIAKAAKVKAEAVSLEQALESYLRARKDMKDATRDDMRKSLKRYVGDWFPRPLMSITDDTVRSRHEKIGERSEARANTTMRYVRAIINHAMVEYTDADGKPVIPSNPVEKLSRQRAWYRVERRRTLVKPHELRPWFEAVCALENEEARDYFLLLILTGLRREEGLQLQWKDVDLVAKTLTVRDPKNRQAHTLPLSDYLFDVLDRRHSTKRADFVFQGPRGRLQNLRELQQRVRDRSGVNFTPHDLRRTFATVADSIDVPGYAVKALLNHKGGADVTAGYIVIDVERLRRPMQAITDYMLRHAGMRTSAEIVPIRKPTPGAEI